MKISSVDFYLLDLGLRRSYSIAYKTITDAENVVVTITLENGMLGIGTSNPSKYVVGEDVHDTITILQQWDKELLLKKDISNLYDCLNIVHTSLQGHAGACAALDIAIHDAFCRWLNKPLVSFLGQKCKSLPTSITIGIMNVEDTLSEAKEYIERRFSFIKIKLGKSLDEDIERLIKLREEFGNKIHIRVDANQGYKEDEILKFYNQTRHLDLELIEQPLLANSSVELKHLPQEIRKCIAADESLIGVRDAFILAIPPASCGIFNIKLMKCAGILPAQHIASIAEAANIDLMWGCYDESMISIAAALHAALSCHHTRYLDLDGSFDLAKDIVQEAFVLKDGMMSVTERPGLGWKHVLS